MFAKATTSQKFVREPAVTDVERLAKRVPCISNQTHLRRLQAKLAIGAVNDPLEQEADAAADRVMRMADPRTSRSARPILSHKCAACEAKETDSLQRSAHGAVAGVDAAPPIVDSVLASSGRALDSATEQFMGNRFGADFSNVRIHTDAHAAESAKTIGALAYAVGRHIVFATGTYAPATDSGRRLIAHELAHTLQQTCGTRVVRRTITTPSAGDATEVAGHINSFCANTATPSGSNVVPAAGACTANTGLGCECACTAMQDTSRTYNISPVPCNLQMSSQAMANRTTQTIPKSSIWPATSGVPCGPAVQINIPKAGSAMEFGAFDASSGAFWYQTWRILAHELCGHGVQCQTYAGGTGNRPQHDSTIVTENLIGAPPTRGHFNDKPRQGEAFTNPIGNRSKITFVLTNGWHYEAP